VDLAALVSEFREGLEKKASDADTTLEIDIAEDTSVFPGDPQAIRAMLLNLLENSLDACRMDKDKDSHTIRLGIRRDPQMMVIEVEDNGMGMDQETREKLFSLFFSSKGGEVRDPAASGGESQHQIRGHRPVMNPVRYA